MVCESWKEKLETYLDGELPSEQMRDFDAHVHRCPECAADTLTQVQMKRAIQVAGKRFAPSADFRRRVQASIAQKPQRSFRMAWMLAAAAMVLVAASLSSAYLARRSSRDRIFSEIADLHVETLASSTPVDVISTDRHTVKPWFQGKIPFAFNLPELQNSDFSLLGGRMTYLDQTPGAHLIYDVRKHHISVFIFPQRSLPPSLASTSPTPQPSSPFNLQTWSQNGLRFFVIGDASPTDINHLAYLFKTAT